jgi:hypothetical protein
MVLLVVSQCWGGKGGAGMLALELLVRQRTRSFTLLVGRSSLF